MVMYRGATLNYAYEPVRFKSKRNTVLLHDGVVEKHFSTIEAAAFEAGELGRLKAENVHVPEVYALDGAVIKMQYIPGETLPDLIARFENASDLPDIQAVADKIIGWLNEFYRAIDTDTTGEIRGDVNGRNFIFDGACCWGVDFEEKSCGIKAQDIGRLIAFVLTYDPPETSVKVMLANKLLQKAVQVFQIESEEICRHRDLEFGAMAQRRKKTQDR